MFLRRRIAAARAWITIASAVVPSICAWRRISRIWGALEIHVDPYAFVDTNQLRLVGNLWVDVAVRLPAAFAVTANPVS